MKTISQKSIMLIFLISISFSQVYSQNLMVKIPETNVYDTSALTIKFNADSDLRFYGIAGTISFDKDHLEFDQIHSMYLDALNESSLNLLSLENGRLSFIYLNPGAVDAFVPMDSSIFEIAFKIISTGCLDSSIVSMTNSDVPWEFVTLQENVIESERPMLQHAKIRTACAMSFASVETRMPVCNQDATGEIAVEVEGGFSPYHYKWSTGEIGPKISDLSGGVYSVTVTDLFKNQTIKRILVNTPTPLEVELRVENSFCGLNNGSVYVDTDQFDGLQITWLDNRMESVWVRESLGQGMVPFKLSNSSGCIKDTFAIIEDDFFEPPNLEDSITLCKGDKVEVFPSRKEIITSWYQSGEILVDSSTSFIPDTTGIYEVRYRAKDQCFELKSFLVDFEEPLLPTWSDTLVTKGSLLTFSYDSGDSIRWSSNEFSLPCIHCPEIEFVAESKGFIQLESRSSNGCWIAHSIFVDVLNVDPEFCNVVTPNGDGINDQFKIDYDVFDFGQVQIFNTYGTLVRLFESLEYFNQWIESQSPNPGTYYYVLEISDYSGKLITHYGDLNILY